jgi:hypothetical protein
MRFGKIAKKQILMSFHYKIILLLLEDLFSWLIYHEPVSHPLFFVV